MVIIEKLKYPTAFFYCMNVQDVERIEGFIGRIWGELRNSRRPSKFDSAITWYWDLVKQFSWSEPYFTGFQRRYTSCELGKSPGKFDGVLDLDQQAEADLGFLVGEGAVDKKTREELIEEFGFTPEDYAGVYENYVSLMNQRLGLEGDIRGLEKQLSLVRSICSRKATRTQRRTGLQQKEAALDAVQTPLQGLDQAISVYGDVKRYILTDKGYYAAINPGIGKYGDVSFQPSEVTSTGNYFKGLFVSVNPMTEPDDQYEVGSRRYTSQPPEENIELRLDIPFEELTDLDIDREQIMERLRAKVRTSISSHLEGSTIGIDWYLDFPDKMYYVTMNPVSLTKTRDEKSIVGTTTFRWGYYPLGKGCGGEQEGDISRDLEMHLLEGNGEFNLIFRRITSTGQYSLDQNNGA